MRALREAVILALAALAPAALTIALHPALADRDRAGLEPDAVRVAEARAWGEPVLWIDARAQSEFAAGAIAGAIHLEPARFDTGLGDVLAAWAPGTRIIVYCGSLDCGTSRELATRLRAAGLEDVHHLHGGWDAWRAADGR